MVIVTGHSRSGTKYMAELLWRFGLDVQHERMGQDGMSAWQAAVLPNEYMDIPWGCPRRPADRGSFQMVQVVRNPWKAIPSILYTDSHPLSLGYRRAFIDLPRSNGPLTTATLSFCRWNSLVREQKPDLVVRVEMAPEVMADFFAKTVPSHLPSRTTNTRARAHKRPWTPAQILASITPEAARELRDFCREYGYRWPAGVAA